MSDRKMLKRYHRYLACLIIVMVTACSSLPSPPATPPKTGEKGWFNRGPSDVDVFYQGVYYLGDKDRTAEYDKAKAAFGEVLTKYPKSKWRGLSETFIRLIETEQLFEEQSRTDVQVIESLKEDKAKLIKDNEQLRKENRKLLEETAKLLQESEQLKKDIQLLKSLEVQLEKREKMLR
ncbi:MAG TPA: hypothetical protein VLZ07_10660 [Syntrophales bacterium]|nr:hypothetical protein [Syntrophales bacterium]